MKRVCATAIALTATLAPMLSAAAPAQAEPLSQSGQSQLIDRVIQRALSQRGVPYVYGGGDIYGPTTGARARAATTPGTSALPGALPGLLPGAGAAALPGASDDPTATPPGTPGFDSSGLIQYAFAAAGIKMPRTSGEQCSVGRRVTPAQALPGDLLCFGPGGTQSVALYLGNNQMIEGTSPAVNISPARTTNMVPYLTRVIN